MILLDIFDYSWFYNHFLYFAGVGGAFALFLFIKIIIKIDRDIKRMNKKSRDTMIKQMRHTSKYKDTNCKRKLSFDDKD